MDTCSSCGSSIPDGQGSSCSMCYGDISYGSDGYYEQWAEQEDRKAEREEESQPESSQSDDDLPF